MIAQSGLHSSILSHRCSPERASSRVIAPFDFAPHRNWTANALGPCACIPSSVERIRAHARLFRPFLARPPPRSIGCPLPTCPSSPPAASQSAAHAASLPLLIGPRALRMQILLGGLDSADSPAPPPPSVELPRYLALSLTTTMPRWFRSEPLLLPPVISCSLPQNYIFQ